MKVLELTGEPIGTGGQEMFIINVLRHIDMSNLAIDWLTPYFCENPEYEKEITSRGGKVYAFSLPFSPGGQRFDLIKPLNHFLKEHKYDVVHIHSGSISVLALCAAVARHRGVKKVIVHSHSTGIKKTFKHHVLKALSYPIFKLCPTNYLACSKDAGAWKYPKSIVKDRLCVVKNGIDLDLFRPNERTRKKYREKLGFRDSDYVIGHVGRFSYQKNQELLVSVMDRIRSMHDDVKLLLIGVGEQMDDVKRLVEQKGLTNNVLMIGSVSNVYDYLQAMDVFAFPSRWEGLPIVGIEAQAAGLPIVASDRITKDMKLVDDVVYIPLENIDGWITTIMSYKGSEKKDNTDIIRKKGFDIDDTANVIKGIYMQ